MPFSDRAKRRTILASTRSLPLAARVAARERLLGNLELGRAKRGTGFIIGHPKSGNTWLRTMISRAYQVKYGLPETLILKSDELRLANPELPAFCVTNGHYSYEGVIGRLLDAESPAPAFVDKPAVFLARHPCDIAVSWYIQFTKRVSIPKRELINARLAHPIDHTTISRWDFVMKSEIGLPSLIDFLNRWERNVSRMKNHLIIRYEDMRAKPAELLRNVTSFFGESFTDAEIEEAVAFSSFDNLKRLESSRVLTHGGYNKVDPKDPETLKVRRGKIRGYRDDFPPERVAEMDALVAERLSPTLGYGPS